MTEPRDRPGSLPENGGETPPIAERPRFGVLASFAIPSYRNLWLSDVLSAWAAEMETIILGWYVLVATDSPLMLSVVAALRFAGTLLTPFTGVVADRLSRRTLLCALRSTFTVLAAGIAVAGMTGHLALWYLFVIATIAGLTRPSEMVLRQSLIADSVPRGLLTNAMGFSRTTMESARIAGALLGASLFTLLGIGVAYAGVALVYLASIAFTLRIAIGRKPGPAPSSAPWADLVGGLAYMRRARVIVLVMWLAFLVNLTAFPLIQGFLPVIARDGFGFDANGLGLMVATVAGGALAGSVLIATLMRSARPERSMLAGLIVWHALIVLFAFVETRAIAFLLLALMGIFASAAMIPMSVVLLGHTEPEYRGRVMGVRMLAVYGLPMGLLLGGVLMERYGVTTSLVTFGTAGLLACLVTALRWNRWTAWRPGNDGGGRPGR